MKQKKFKAVEPYQPYLQDGQKHYLTERDSSTNYRMAYFNAFADRFPEKAIAYIPEDEIPEEMLEEVEEVLAEENEEEVEEAAPEVKHAAPVAAPVVAPKKKCCCCCKRKTKKNVAAIAIAFVATILFVALAALSFFKVFANFTSFFAGANAKDFYDATINIIGNPKGYGMLNHAFVGTALLSALLVVVSLVVGIIALASKKKVCGVGVIALIALVSWLACGIICYFNLGIAKDSAAIIKFVHPMKVSVGAMLGYYIAAAILIIETICGFCSYGVEKK